MSGELELVSDGTGLAVVGHPSDVEQFLVSTQLVSAKSRTLDTKLISRIASAGGSGLSVASQVAENSGRWVKLTAESAEAVRRFGLMPTKVPGVSHAMIGKPGDIARWLQIDKLATSAMSGPFVLTALSTVMQQQALQQQMDEIVEYLEVINQKVDEILRGQKDSVLADLIGVDLVIDEALTVSSHVGRVSEVTWSKVQATSMTIARTQAYCLRQLDAVSEKLEKQVDLGDIAKATEEADAQIREWLAVLAHTYRLQDGLSQLEIARIADSSPSDLEIHRVGLVASREKRVELIDRTSRRILQQMDSTIERANARVLLNPFDSPAAVASSNRVAEQLHDFRSLVGIESELVNSGAKRWTQAVFEVRDKAVSVVADSVETVGRFSANVIDDTTRPFRSEEVDGVREKPRAAVAADEVGEALKNAGEGIADAFGTFFKRKKNEDD